MRFLSRMLGQSYCLETENKLYVIQQDSRTSTIVNETYYDSFSICVTGCYGILFSLTIPVSLKQ